MLKKLAGAILYVMAISTAGAADSEQDRKDALTAYFKSDEEPSVLDAVWTSDKMFKVGMYDRDGPKDGFAMYVCSVMKDYGFGAGYSAQVIDIIKLVRDSDWVTLGEAQCK